MKIIPLRRLLSWIFTEYAHSKTIFGYHEDFFYFKKDDKTYKLFNGELDTIIGPAAGPHTQLTQNILVAYLAGSRYIELKTIQENDNLEIDRPCIDAEDEGYNVEWSQELKLAESFNEYLKARLLIVLLNKIFKFSPSENGGVIFNMSVGYNLTGIQSPRVDAFLNRMNNAALTDLFKEYKGIIIEFVNNSLPQFKDFLPEFQNSELIRSIENISPVIAESVTLSTMHGCPAHEIGAIAEYLLLEKKLATLVKLNPTLLGYDRTREILDGYGYRTVQLSRPDFEHDLQLADAISLLSKLLAAADEKKRYFGIKLSNTLCADNTRGRLKGEKNYLSGRALYPLTSELTRTIKAALPEIKTISYSGGADRNNISQIAGLGCMPITLATDLLKPGGYTRLYGLVRQLEGAELQVVDNRKCYERNFSALKKKKSVQTLPLFDCFTAPCKIACPVGQDVPEYLELCRQERFAEAFAVIVDKNPLPNITGWICDHKCQFSCTRGEFADPVEIRNYKKEAVEKGYEQYMQKIRQADKSALKIAVIGAGPAGLSAAFFAARNGFKVTVYEKEKSAGGTVRYTIPGFRIPADVISRDVEFISRHGVDFKFDSGNVRVDDLLQAGYNYVFVAVGAQKAKDLKLASTSDHIYEATAFLRDFNRDHAPVLGKKVVVIGGGNSAMDGARAAVKVAGVESVSIVYRRTKDQMPADLEEFEAAMADGVVFCELLAPESYAGGALVCQKMVFGKTGSDGRLTIVPQSDQKETIAADSLILAVGEEVDRDFLAENNLIVQPGLISAGRPNVFIGGDALHGPATVIEAAADGRAFVQKILENSGSGIAEPDFCRGLFNAKEIPPVIRKRKKALLLSSVKQPDSCLLCHLECNRCADVCPNRANVVVAVGDGPEFKDATQIVHLYDLCNECGNCATFCPYDAAPYKEKLTWYSNLEDMSKSANPGFSIRRVANSYKLYIRKLAGGWQQEISADELGIGDLRMKKVIAAFIEQYGFLIENQ